MLTKFRLLIYLVCLVSLVVFTFLTILKGINAEYYFGATYLLASLTTVFWVVVAKASKEYIFDELGSMIEKHKMQE